MSQIEQRIIDLGFVLPETAKPLAAYIPTVKSGNLVFTSGQLPMIAGSLAETGKVACNHG